MRALEYRAPPRARNDTSFSREVIKVELIVMQMISFIAAFLLMSSWSWVIVCAPDVFSWNFIFLIVNFIQTILVLYRLRPVKFAQELEDVYQVCGINKRLPK